MNKKLFSIEVLNNEIDILEKYDYNAFDIIVNATDLDVKNSKELFLNKLEKILNSDEEYDFSSLTFNGLNYYKINDCYSILENEDLSIFKSDKDTVIKYIDSYLKAALGVYVYYEYDYSGFGKLNYFYDINFICLYLCGKYYESIKEHDKAVMSYFICMACYMYISDDSSFVGLFEEFYDSFAELITGDWLTLHPQITYSIGKYCLEKKDYRQAFSFFHLGSSINYEGRQSLEPFIHVGKNKYELGMLYYKGLSVEVDYEKALSYFEDAASDFGEPSLPIIGDMYYFGNGVDVDHNEALNSYITYNKYNVDEYIEYKYLTAEQNQRAIDILKKCLSLEKNRTYSLLKFASNALQNRLNDPQLLSEIEQMKQDLLLKTDPEDRDDDMNNDYVSFELNRLKILLEHPTENTGFIPSELKVGDVFTFGKFNGEPLQWKVLGFNKNGSAYVISTKIVAKMSYEMVPYWLNEDFIIYSFTDEEKAQIVPHNYYQFYNEGQTFIYLASADQIIGSEGTYKAGTIEETELAKKLNCSKNLLCLHGEIINETGEPTDFICKSSVEGIRPAMDVYFKN